MKRVNLPGNVTINNELWNGSRILRDEIFSRAAWRTAKGCGPLLSLLTKLDKADACGSLILDATDAEHELLVQEIQMPDRLVPRVIQRLVGELANAIHTASDPPPDPGLS